MTCGGAIHALLRPLELGPLWPKFLSSLSDFHSCVSLQGLMPLIYHMFMFMLTSFLSDVPEISWKVAKNPSKFL